MKDICLYPGCREQSRTRGLCNRHYSAAFYLVEKKGVLTWKCLEKSGKVKPPERDRLVASWFLEAVNK